MSDTTYEAEAHDRMTSEGSPPPRTADAQAGSRRGTGLERLRALIAGLRDVRSAAGTRFRVARPLAARFEAARRRHAAHLPALHQLPH